MTKPFIFSDSDDINQCKTGPFPRPPKGPLPKPYYNWFTDTIPRGYKPFMVRVTQDIIHHGSLTFMFLHNETGLDLSGPHTMTQDELNDQTKAYSKLPASALAVDLKKSPKNDCGFLFLDADYAGQITPIPVTGGTIDLLTDSAGDGKYPAGADTSALASALQRVLAMAKGDETMLTAAERAALQDLSRIVGAV